MYESFTAIIHGSYMSIFEEYLYIDYENVQDVKVDIFGECKKTLKSILEFI